MNYQERKYKILIDLDGVLNNYNGNYEEFENQIKAFNVWYKN